MYRYLRTALALVACLQFVLTGWAQVTANLSKQGWYADPEIHIFAGQYWIYPTSSSPDADSQEHRTFNPLQQKLRSGHVVHPIYLLHTSLDAFSSPDLVHWTRHPGVLDIKNVSWAAYAIWAPTAIHLNGKYYLFFAANDIQKKDTFPGGIGVAVSDKPGGPFVDALGKPLIGEFHKDEDAVRATNDIGGRRSFTVDGRDRVSDGFIENKAINEVKNVASLSYTQQLKDYVAYAKSQSSLAFHLYVRPGNATRLSPQLQQAVGKGDIVLRSIKVKY